jgi:hypothetical protein
MVGRFGELAGSTVIDPGQVPGPVLPLLHRLGLEGLRRVEGHEVEDAHVERIKVVVVHVVKEKGVAAPVQRVLRLGPGGDRAVVRRTEEAVLRVHRPRAVARVPPERAVRAHRAPANVAQQVLLLLLLSRGRRAVFLLPSLRLLGEENAVIRLAALRACNNSQGHGDKKRG